MIVAPFSVAAGERRVCTLLFCDVRGSTAIAERLDPEDWAEIMNGAFAALVAPVTRYEGTVARLMGDAILSYFGAPVSHEDDATRAVLAGLEMIRSIGEYGTRVRAARDLPELTVRIGVNTGLVVLENVRAGSAIEYTAMGDVANVAARLQALAEPGTIVVSEATYRQIADDFAASALGEVEVKGRAGPVKAHVITGRAGAAPAAWSTPLIGRDAQLETLRRAVMDVRSGRGRVLALVGEGGLGKTRLIRETEAYWRAMATGEHAHWSAARGESYQQQRPYGLVRPHVLEICDISESDPPEIMRSKIRAQDGGCCGGECSIAGVLAARDASEREEAFRALDLLLAVDEEGARPALEGEPLREELERLVGEIVRLHHAHDSGVLVFDDLHWSDSASAEITLRLARLTEDTPILVLLSFRPDRGSPAWRIRQSLETDLPHRYDELPLDPLAEPDARALIGALTEDLAPAVVARVLAKAEGNPLFIEEIVRSVAGGQVRIPESIQAMLGARIDRLEPDVRHVAQAAAVIGRTFAHPVLAAVADLDGAVDRALLALERAGIVHEEARVPERTYAFRHALVQESVYASLLQRRRRELHGATARALVAISGDRVDERASTIAHHFAEAGDPEALRYVVIAADRAIRLHTLDDALAILARGFDLATGADRRAVIDLFVRRGRVHELRADYAAAIATYDELAAEAKSRGDKGMRAEALARLATLYTMPASVHDPDRAGRLTAEAVELAREGGERELLARLQWTTAFGAQWRGEIDDALRAGEEALAVAREVGLEDLEATTLNTLGHVYRELGRMDDSIAALDAAAAIFRRRGNIPMVIDTIGLRAFASFLAGRPQEGAEIAEEGRRLADEINHAFGKADVGFYSVMGRSRAGDYQRAIAEWKELIGYAESAGHVGAEVLIRSELAGDEIAIGQVELAAETLAAAERVATGTPLADWLVGPMARLEVVRGRFSEARSRLDRAGDAPRIFRAFVEHGRRLARIELALAEGDPDGAADIARAWREEQRASGTAFELPEIFALEGEALERAGRATEALTVLAEGERVATETGDRRALWRILAARARAHEALGEREAADETRARAVAIVEMVAAQLSPEQRASFRARQDVCELTGPVTNAETL
jgi:class 3 adenylate cyclase/tetratricopeptide (TPR) repeat protein